MRLSGFSAPWADHTRMAVLAGLSLWAGILVVLGLALAREHRQALSAAADESATLTAVFEENTARSFGSVDVALQGFASHFGATQLDRHDPAARALMRAQLPHVPTVRAFFVIRPDGFIAHDTDFPRTPDVSLADRPYFRAFRERADLQHALSPPLQSRSGTGWFVASTRRITGPAGEFKGVVVAAVQLDSVAQLYQKLGLTAGQSMALFQTDGQLVAVYPPGQAQVGQRYAELPLFASHLPARPAGVYRGAADASGEARIVAYRQLDAQPLVVVFTTTEETVLAPWRRTAAGAALAAVLMALLIAAGVMFFVQRQAHRLRAAAHRAAEQQLRTLADQLANADRLKTEFLATLSHELRNVLAPLQTSVKLMEMAPPASAPGARAREIVHRQLDVMRGLVDELLDLSRVNSGKMQLALVRADLCELLAAAAAAAQSAMDAQGHRFETQLPTQPVWADVDRNRMMQVLANLLGNAAKYTPSGGHVRLVLHTSADMAMVEVIDNGIGIPQEALGRVFGMFEQVGSHAAHAQGGLGIGLALVHRLVQLHGGQVKVHSTGPGQGSTFSVRLPLAAQPAAALAAQPPASLHH